MPDIHCKVTYEDAQAETYALIEKLTGNEYDCGNERVNRIVFNFLNGFDSF